MHHPSTDERPESALIDAASAPTGRYADIAARLDAIIAPMARTPTLAPANIVVLPFTPTRRRQRGAWRAGGAAVIVATLAFGFVQAPTSLRSPPAPLMAAAPLSPAKPVQRMASVIPTSPPVANLAVATRKIARDAPTDDRPAAIERRAPVQVALATRPLRTLATVRSAPCQIANSGVRYDCLKDNLRQADRELVDAYADAADANVPLRLMVNVNRRWDDARRAVRDDPDGALAEYRTLTTELRSVAVREDRQRGG